MGWLKIALFTALVLTSSFAWKPNTDYIYTIRTRTLSSSEDGSNEYSGMFMKGRLYISPREDNNYVAKLSDLQVAQAHMNLPGGWNSEVSDSQLNYRPLSHSNNPFKIIMRNGVIVSVLVAKGVPDWEINIIKGIVSQIQLDTKGENIIESRMNQVPKEDKPFGVYKTMEESITGKIETTYEIRPYPEYLLQSEPWLAPLPHLRNGGEFIEVLKTKNYTNSEERPAFNFGFYTFDNPWQNEPSSNTMGKYFVRSADSRAIISGTLQHYIIQSVSTTNKAVFLTNLEDKMYGIVFSKSNITLHSMQPSSSISGDLSSLVPIDSLIYKYAVNVMNPYNQEGQQQDELIPQDANRDKPFMLTHSPLLAYLTTAIESGSQSNVVQTVKEIFKQIGQELANPENMDASKTLDKYVTATSLLRSLNEKQLESISEELYSTKNQGVAGNAWRSFRDSVAEAGTEPALFTIQSWIKNGKLDSDEAANVVERMVKNVIIPNDKYVKDFYSMISQPEVEQTKKLNVSATLAFSELLYDVYVNRIDSENKFETKYGNEFVVKEYIPHLKKMLQHAVSEADNQKICLYIVALGEIAHREILEIFKPYLEGERKITQFQRLVMVSSLSKLARTDPEAVRPVLYRIYQNIGEDESIRVEAVYNLMFTVPPKGMMQRIAEYTHIDPSEQVTSAVKSIILSASKLRGNRFSALQRNAMAASPLLTPKVQGQHLSKGYLYSFTTPDLGFLYKQTVNWIGSHDRNIPKSLYYSWRSHMAGFSTPLMKLQAKVSSMADLINEVENLFKAYHPQSSENEQYSAENIVKMKNMQPREEEELEGLFMVNFFGLKGNYMFNNRSIKDLTQKVKEWQEKLQSGRKVHYTRIINNNNLIATFPMETGSLFFYNLNKPQLIQVDGEVTVTAQPQLSSGSKMTLPETMNLDFDMQVSIARTVQARFGFLTDFDYQVYIAGNDRNTQVYVPLVSKAVLDRQNRQFKLEMQLKEHTKQLNLFRCNSYTYTSHTKMGEINPLLEHKNTRIHRGKQVGSDDIYGKDAGMVFRISRSWEEGKRRSMTKLQNIIGDNGVANFVNNMYSNSGIRESFDVEYLKHESVNPKVIVTFSYNVSSRCRQTPAGSESVDLHSLSQVSAKDPVERISEMSEKAAVGIKSSKTHAYDVDVQFVGQSNSEYTATLAVGYSPVDKNSRTLFLYRKQANPSQSKPYLVALTSKQSFPNTNGLDFEYALNFDPTSTIQMHAAFGKDMKSASKVSLHLQMKKSEKRRHSMQELIEYHRQKNKIEKGVDHIDPNVWAALTAKTNLMDHITANINYEQMNPAVKEIAQRAVYLFNQHLGDYMNLTYKESENKNEDSKNKIDIHASFNPELGNANLSIRMSEKDMHYERLPVAKWIDPVVVIHPVFSVKDRLMNHLLQLQTYRPVCISDQNYVSTFKNRTYPLHLSDKWSVVLFYEPRISYERYETEQQQQEQLQEELRKEQYTVMERSHGQQQKEVKIVIRSPENKGKYVEINMVPSGASPRAKVYVNQQILTYNDREVTEAEDGLIELYALPNEEVKLVIKDAFYVIYDGSKAKITVTNDKFHGRLRGLCGTYTEGMRDDFIDASNCVLNNPDEFVAAYTLHSTPTRQSTTEEKCIKQEVNYGEYITQRDVNPELGTSDLDNASRCIKHQTQYLEDESNHKVCFTVRTVPTCQKGCRGIKFASRPVEMHCVRKNNVTDLWKKQIDMGASPDFSHKVPHKTVKMEMPVACAPVTY